MLLASNLNKLLTSLSMVFLLVNYINIVTEVFEFFYFFPSKFKTFQSNHYVTYLFHFSHQQLNLHKIIFKKKNKIEKIEKQKKNVDVDMPHGKPRQQTVRFNGQISIFNGTMIKMGENTNSIDVIEIF